MTIDEILELVLIVEIKDSVCKFELLAICLIELTCDYCL